MKRSTDRILTSHTGSLPRPQPLIDLVLAQEKGETIDAGARGSTDEHEADEPDHTGADGVPSTDITTRTGRSFLVFV